jgi:uncharacterized membrane protein YfcA
MEILLLAAAGVLAGAMNAVAGGGSFVSMPALMAAGLPATQANASSTVALFPGALSSTWAYRRDIRPFGKVGLVPLTVVSVVGGFVGAVLLLATPTSLFDRVIPWLLLLATVTLVFGPRVREALARRDLAIGPIGALTGQAFLGVYAGYFGGAVGLMMLAFWTLITHEEVKAVNPARAMIVGLANAAAVVCFAVAGAVWWPQTLAVMAGAVVGGYAGARFGQRLPAPAVRAVVIAVTAFTTAAFFWRAYA